jgi:hypothetical protein
MKTITSIYDRQFRLLLLSTLIMSGCASADIESTEGDGGELLDRGFAAFDEGLARDGFQNSRFDRGMDPVNDASMGNQPDRGAGVMIPIPDNLASNMAQGICDYIERCQYRSVFEGVLNEPCQQFMERQFQDTTIARLAPLVAAGAVMYDPQGTSRCLQAISRLECTPDFAALAMACLDSFSGTGEVGSACTEHEACADMQFCAAASMCPGRCEFRGGVDIECSTDAGCELGLNCINRVCKAPVGINQPCGGTNAACEGGLYCTGENGGAGQCRAFDARLLGQNQTCNIEGGPLCGEGLACIAQIVGFSVEFRCATRVGAGATCYPGLPDHCSPGLFCHGTDIDALLPDIEGNCRPLPAEGQPCGQAPVFKVCATGNVCDGNLCTPRSRIGGACQSDEACYSARCQNSACVASTLCTP